jgi:pimeloyl-ACP methyl ester carboxylesterase
MGFVEAGGSRLYYEETGDGPPILLIPPSGATAATWGTLVDRLAGVGRVIAYDRRGYRRSGGGVVRSAAVHTADAAALLQAVGGAPAVVVGTSAGATIALDLAVRRPDLCRAVVSHESPWRALLHPDVASLSTLATVQWLAWRGRYGDAAEVLLRRVYVYRDGGSAWDAFPDEWRRIARDHGQCVIADLRATLRSYPRAADLAAMSTPVVCTHGSRSLRFMCAVTRSLAEAIPTATLRRIDGAAHAVPFDAPAAFAQVIADVIRPAAPAPSAAPRGS